MLSDDELTVLGSNFHSSKAGWIAGKECTLLEDGPWVEDLLVSQDEQRALAVGFLYVYRDPGYLARREEALRGELRRYAQDHHKWVAGKAMESTKAAVDLFQQNMARLDEEGGLDEGKWLARYDEYVATLRTALHSIASLGPRSKESRAIIEPRLEDVITVAEDDANEKICNRVPLTEPGFPLFWAEQKNKIQHQFQQEIRQGFLYKPTYFRWMGLSAEEQALYVRNVAPRLIQGDDSRIMEL